MGAGGKAFEDNGWFVGFAPRRNPEIVVVVLSRGRRLGWQSGVIAPKIIRAYLEKQHRQALRIAQSVARGSLN
jgi:penicillin-binding protein 2